MHIQAYVYTAAWRNKEEHTGGSGEGRSARHVFYIFVRVRVCVPSASVRVRACKRVHVHVHCEFSVHTGTCAQVCVNVHVQELLLKQRPWAAKGNDEILKNSEYSRY